MSCSYRIHTSRMSRAIGVSFSFSLVLSQFIASCLGQYANGMATAGGLSDGGFGSRLGYSCLKDPVTPWPMGLGPEYVQQPGYVGECDQRLGYGGSSGPVTGYPARYGQGLGYPGNCGVTSVFPNAPDEGYGPPGYGFGYGGRAILYNVPTSAQNGDGMPAYPFPPLYSTVNDAPAIASAQPSALLTSNDNSNSNTNININNELGKPRRGLLSREIFGIPRL